MSETYKDHGYKLKIEFDNFFAKPVYRLYHIAEIRGQCEISGYSIFKGHWSRTDYGEWDKFESFIEQGNKAWATKIAKHYNIAMPEEVSR